jgi:hypothetical protein
MRISDIPLDQLPAAGRKAFSGFLLHQEALKLPGSLGENLLTAVSDAESKDTAYYTSAAGFSQIGKVLAEADEAGITAIEKAKNYLRHKLGFHWSPEWAQAGFTQNTLQAPKSMEARQQLLVALSKYFAERPDWGSNEEPKVDAQILAAAAADLKAALDREASQSRAHKILIGQREQAGALVCSRLRALMDEAALHLADDDVRFADFGFDSPAAARAAKPARDQRNQTKAEKAAQRRYDVAVRRAEEAKVRSEKLRVRADKAQVDADRLRAEADEAAGFTESLFNKARELAATILRSPNPEIGIDDEAPPQRSGQPASSEALAAPDVPLLG